MTLPSSNDSQQQSHHSGVSLLELPIDVGLSRRALDLRRLDVLARKRPASYAKKELQSRETVFGNEYHSGPKQMEVKDAVGVRVMNVKRRLTEDGFGAIELVIVLTILAVVGAFGIIQVKKALQSYRALSNARNIASQLSLAKMRAANGFTQSRLNCDLTAQSCQLEVCTSKGATTCNTFTAEGGPILLAQGTTFGFGSITTAAGTQTTIQNTAQIIFNSRGIPVDSTGAATGNYGLYVTTQVGDNYAVTVYPSGRVSAWRYSSGAWSIQ